MRPEAGNSFWVSRLGKDSVRLHLGTARYYRVPSSESVLDVAAAFVEVGKSVQARVPQEVSARFGLIETDQDDFDRLWETEWPAE